VSAHPPSTLVSQQPIVWHLPAPPLGHGLPGAHHLKDSSQAHSHMPYAPRTHGGPPRAQASFTLIQEPTASRPITTASHVQVEHPGNLFPLANFRIRDGSSDARCAVRQGAEPIPSQSSDSQTSNGFGRKAKGSGRPHSLVPILSHVRSAPPKSIASSTSRRAGVSLQGRKLLASQMSAPSAILYQGC
jgi:hypothetical protein